MSANASINAPIAAVDGILKTCWYAGTDALFKGEGLCYNTDYGTATTADSSRANRVERPTASNNSAFAGVLALDYDASSVGQFVDIYVPGSRGVPVALAVDTVINTGILTFCVAGRYDVGASTGLTTDAGRFYTGKFKGRGSAIPRQTVTALIESSMTGGWSLANDGVTLTVSDTTGLAAGDTVVLLGGADDATDTLKPGKYTISSVTNATTLVLSSSAAAVTTPTSAVTCTGYAYTGNPTAICDLCEGPEESGGVEFLNLPNAGGDSQPYMTGGVSYVCGGITLANDAECELAQGTYPMELKAFHLLGTLTTNDFVVDLVSNGLQLDGSSALAEVNGIDAAGEGCVLLFGGAKWHTLDLLGSAAEA